MQRTVQLPAAAASATARRRLPCRSPLLRSPLPLAEALLVWLGAWGQRRDWVSLIGQHVSGHKCEERGELALPCLLQVDLYVHAAAARPHHSSRQLRGAEQEGDRWQGVPHRRTAPSADVSQ